MQRDWDQTITLLGVGGGLLVIGLTLWLKPPTLPSDNNLKQQRIQQYQQQLELNATQSAQQEVSRIAIERYQAGCIMVVSQANPSKATTLTEGKPVIDASRNVPLANGMTVCDYLGNTGIIENGKVAQMAWTGDRASVEAAKQRLTAQFLVPGQ